MRIALLIFGLVNVPSFGVHVEFGAPATFVVDQTVLMPLSHAPLPPRMLTLESLAWNRRSWTKMLSLPDPP